MQYVMRATTSNEFLDWVDWLDWKDWKRATTEHWYLAQIAFEVARGNINRTNPEDLKFEDFLLKFVTGPQTPKDEPLTEEKLQERIAHSKAAWYGMLGGPPTQGGPTGATGGPPTAPNPAPTVKRPTAPPKPTAG